MRVAARFAITAFFATSAIAIVGVFVGRVFANAHARVPCLESFAHSDGQHYSRILVDGYAYDAANRSEVAFFPAFPLAGRLVAAAGRLSPTAALVLTSNVFLASCFLVLGAYTHARAVARSAIDGERGLKPAALVTWTLLAFGLLPMTFFFHMAYSESTFLLFCLLSFYGMQRGWAIPLVATLVGATTACRPVGVALIPPLLLHVWRSSDSRLAAAVRCIALLPLACWGIGAFMLFQYARFGEALAFMETQEHWVLRPPTSVLEKYSALLAWEPIWTPYSASCARCYWGNQEPAFGLLNCQFMNPVFFLGTAVSVAVGACRRWLQPTETLLSIGLLAIPYITKAYENGMNSQGRFAAAVFPAYLVVGHLLARLPVALASIVLTISGLLMGTYAALFAAGYPFF